MAKGKISAFGVHDVVANFAPEIAFIFCIFAFYHLVMPVL